MLNLEPSAYLITIITLSNEYTVKEYIHIRGPVMARVSCRDGSIAVKDEHI